MPDKILLAGNWKWDIYEEAFARGFEEAGLDVVPFVTTKIKGMPTNTSLAGRLRLKNSLAPLNEELLRQAVSHKPRVIFLWRCDTVLPETIAKLKSTLPATTIIAYHNDNPYQGLKEYFKNRHFLNSLKYVDIAAVYRPDNLAKALKYGAPRAELILPSFIRSLHLPRVEARSNDVVFVGHYEDDGRMQVLNSLVEAGINIQIQGTGWQSMQKRFNWLAEQDIHQVWGEEYVSTLSSSKICLAFLSKKNRDVYTRRCFEIPACGSLLFAPRTPELEHLFKDGKEAIFWDSTQDLIEKVIFYLGNDSLREDIAQAGLYAVRNRGHDEYARAKQILNWINN